MGWGCSSVGSSIGPARCRCRFDSPVRQGIFLPESTFSADSYGVRTPPCAIACTYICAHVKDPVVHVKVRWIMETLKHPACTVGWVARLSQLAFPWGKQPAFPMGEIPLGQYTNTTTTTTNNNKNMRDDHSECCAQTKQALTILHKC